MKNLNIFAYPLILISLFATDALASTWTENLKFSGDLRFRNEQITQTPANSDTAEDIRQRVRARLKMSAKVNDQAKVVFRLATGGGSTTSTNQSLDDSGSNKAFDLDQAYVDYKTMGDDGSILAGKMVIPTYRAGKNELMFDGDQTPEGMAFKYKCSSCETWQPFFNASALWLDERSASQADIGLVSAQVGTKFDLGEESAVVVGLGSHTASPIKGKSLSTGAIDGHTDDGTGGYQYEFATQEFFAVYEGQFMNGPFSLYTNVFTNPDSEQEAYIVGLSIGKAKKPKSFALAYNFRRVEKDVLLNVLSDGDFNGGDSDSIGHVLKMAYVAAENSTIKFTYGVAQAGIDLADRNEHTYGQLDFIFKF